MFCTFTGKTVHGYEKNGEIKRKNKKYLRETLVKKFFSGYSLTAKEK